MPTISIDDYKVSYYDDQETKDKVFQRVMEYYLKHEQFVGEGIMQCDDPIIDAPNVLADIADDIIKFKISYTE